MNFGDPGAEHRSGNAGGRRDANFGYALAAQCPREQLAVDAVVKKQRRPLGVERVGDQVYQSRQLMIEGKQLGDRVGDIGQYPQASDLVDQLPYGRWVVTCRRRDPEIGEFGGDPRENRRPSPHSQSTSEAQCAR
jgi:hypothetical protein